MYKKNKLPIRWDLDSCRSDALKYSTRTEWNKASKAAYTSAWRNGWLDECCKHMATFSKPAGYWSRERCIADALLYNSRSQWNTNSDGYQIARRNGWLEECCQHMARKCKPNRYWSMERCRNEALKFNNKSEWERSSGASYITALKNKWMEYCCEHMTDLKRPNQYWTKEKCIEDSLKYTNKNDWMNASGGAYQAAHVHGWMLECCQHMKNEGGSSSPERELFSKLKEFAPEVIKKRFINKKEKFKCFDLDIYHPVLNIGIEFNGKYWHSFSGLKRSHPSWSDDDIKKYHEIKREFFRKMGINYLEIQEVEWKEDKDKCIQRCIAFLESKLNE